MKQDDDTHNMLSSVQLLSRVWLWDPHGLQHARLPCPLPTPGAYSNSHSLSQWCHPTISSSVVPFSSRLHSFPASGSSPMSQFFASGGQSIGASASGLVLPISLVIKGHILGSVSHSTLPIALWAVPPMNTQDWSPLGWTGWISLQSKGLSRVFNTTVQKHQFLGAQLSL